MPAARSHRRTWSAFLVVIALSVAAGAVDQPPTPSNTAVAPEPRAGAWMKLHREFLDRASRGDVGLLFLGDSITAGWNTAGQATWDRHYAPRRAANFGIGGDRTQHLLWRIENGEVDGIKPRVVVLMAGTNNLGNNTEEQVIEGVGAVVTRLRSKLPEAKVLLLGIFPRGASLNPAQPFATPDPRVAQVNARLAKIAFGPEVWYLDIGARFLDSAGHVSKAIQPDFLHLTRQGYQIWADAIEPTLWEMMDEKR